MAQQNEATLRSLQRSIDSRYKMIARISWYGLWDTASLLDPLFNPVAYAHQAKPNRNIVVLCS
jgi:hypothetical protein